MTRPCVTRRFDVPLKDVNFRVYDSDVCEVLFCRCRRFAMGFLFTA